MAGVEERLEEVERLLREVLERLEALERLLYGLDSSAARAVRLAVAAGLPVARAVEASLRVLEAVSMLGRVDPVTEALLEALSTCEPLSVSEATRRVQRLRGAASRTTVRKRLQVLLERGIVVKKGEGTGARYLLASCSGARQR